MLRTGLKRMQNVVVACGLIAALSVPARPVQALSCMRPDFSRNFEQLQADEGVYHLAHGTLRPAERLPRIPGDRSVQPQRGYSARYSFEGSFLTGRKTVAGPQVQRNVTVEVGCVSVWCGAFPVLKSPGLMFLRQEPGGGLSLEVGACGGDLLADPTLEQIGAINQCLRKGRCGRAEKRPFGTARR